jgi:hypothetical protein
MPTIDVFKLFFPLFRLNVQKKVVMHIAKLFLGYAKICMFLVNLFPIDRKYFISIRKLLEKIDQSTT